MTVLNLPTRLDFKAVESKWTALWDEKKYFHPQVNEGQKTFSIAFPPPNVTGSLHMGHAANISIQDALVRGRRMQGYNTLWMVGTDHAGIGTQVMVERMLKKEGTSRQELGREKFLERVWEWKEQYGNRIMEQMKRMGASGDYRRARFTMDEQYSKAIRHVFVDWYNKGLIYRAERMVNWDYASQTVLSDLEVESEPEKGHLWHLRYPLSDGSGEIIVATTRPETMLGDTAVAVHPDDERYQDLIGKTVTLPLVGREIPIVADPISANPEFGSGAVKITPAHDFNDYECGQRNHLETLQVIDFHARINDNAPEKYRGLKVNKAREAVVADLQEQGFLVKVDDHEYLPGRSSRTGVVVEPLPMVQWWVNMEPLAKPALESVRAGQVKYHPERFGELGVTWLEDVRDWCISRQLWWGHQIPVWYDAQGEIAYVGLEDPDPSEVEAQGWTRDEDVLDTWFSSALWPFATLGWPENTPELAHFHPTSVLSTARDILNLWVARMIFSSLYFRDEIPFENVLVHATVLTKDGRRMSKSKGTGIDPLDMVDIYGADAVRFWLAQETISRQDVRFAEDKLQDFQRFVTKIWNASRFVLMNLEDYNPEIGIDDSQLELVDRWILSRLHKTAEVVNQSLEDFSLTFATRQLYDFIWSEFCDWYLEISKPRLSQDSTRAQVQAILVHCLDTLLRLLHPFMPFVSEELWSNGLRQVKPDLEAAHLCVAPLPRAEDLHAPDEDAQAQMDILMETVRVIRNLRMEAGVPANKQVEKTYLVSDDAAKREILAANALMIKAMAKVGELSIQSETVEMKHAAHGVAHSVRVVLPLAGLIDVDKERERLQREIAKIEKEQQGLKARLDNPKFVERAPEHVVHEAQTQLKELRYKVDVLSEKLADLKELEG